MLSIDDDKVYKIHKIRRKKRCIFVYNYSFWIW